MTVIGARYVTEEQPRALAPLPPAEGPALEVIGLRKRYGGPRYAIDGVTVSFEDGLTGLLGPNGAGKSTLMRCIAAIENWDDGEIRIGSAGNGRRVRQLVGYMPESVAFPRELRVRDLLRFVCAAKGVGRRWREEVDAKLEVTGLASVGKRVIGNLSKGYRQRLGLAQAMIGDPPVLILDEPVSSLDPMQLIDVRGTIRDYARSACVVVSTHQLAEATALCDRVVLLDHGRIAFDGPISEMGRAALRTFDVEVLAPDEQAVRSRLAAANGVDGVRAARGGELLIITLSVADDRDLASRISGLVELGCGVVGVRPVRDALEAAFSEAVASAPRREEDVR